MSANSTVNSILQFVFKCFDTDHNDKMDIKELKVLIQAMKLPILSDAKLKHELTLPDKAIDFKEFSELMVADDFQHIRHLLDTFRSFDADNDGFITGTELKTVMVTFGVDVDDEEIVAIIQRSDQNNDGKINFKEYLQAGSSCFARTLTLWDLEDMVIGLHEDVIMSTEEPQVEMDPLIVDKENVDGNKEDGGCWRMCGLRKKKKKAKKMKKKSHVLVLQKDHSISVGDADRVDHADSVEMNQQLDQPL